MKRIHDSIDRVFQRHRIVFWYDATGEWASTFAAYNAPDACKLKVVGNDFGTKVRIVQDPNPAAHFLVYIPAPRPPDAENWLLDLLLQGYEYKADKASLAIQEVGLPHAFQPLAEEHSTYFESPKRIQALKDLVGRDDNNDHIRLKMMAVLAGTSVEVDELLLSFMAGEVQAALLDPISDCLESSGLTTYFWKEVKRLFGYDAATPSLRDFVVSLFRGANPLDDELRLHPHAKVFMQRWKDSLTHNASFRRWSSQMEKEMQIHQRLESLDERTNLGDCDTFEAFEKFTLHRLCNRFTKGALATDLRNVMTQRRGSFWRSAHEHGYDALEEAVELRELLATAEIAMDSIAVGINRYTTTWWRIDMAYRRCTWNLRRYGQVNVMEQVAQWVEKAYVNNFLGPLSERWGDQVKALDTWVCPEVTAQRQFYTNYVQPFMTKGQKVFVIVSDALRLEAAKDFANRISSANRWTAEVEVLFGSLPSYTQLGMASLLPGRTLAMDAHTAAVTVDGRSATGTANRNDILSLACQGKATAIQAEEFLELNTKSSGRALMRDHEVIYIFQNVIDKTGDSMSTEAKTFDAVELAFEELNQIIKKIANINGSNMLLTADHGFIFQQDDVAEEDDTTLPDAKELTFRNRRFCLGTGISDRRDLKVFSYAQLNLAGDGSAVFPSGAGRFPLKGSGKRFVHGGTSLQEILIPVVKIHKARTDDTDKVEVELVRVPAKITTGQLSIALFQDQPAAAKIQPRTLRIGVYAKDGRLISELKGITFDSMETEARQREVTVLIVLSHAADAYNNQEVDLRLEETVPGTTHIVTYKTHSLKLQKPFMSDFDE